MSSSSLSEIDSDTFEDQKSPDISQKGVSPERSEPEKDEVARKSPRTSKSTKSSQKPVPGTGNPQPNSRSGSRKRSATEAELDSAPMSEKAAAKSPPADKPFADPRASQPNARPTRHKTQPSRLRDEIDAQPARPARSSRKKKKTDNWETDHLLHNPDSRLLKLAASDLKKVLLDVRAWTCLSSEEKDELVSMLPGGSLPRLLEDNTEPDMLHEYLRYNEVFADDLGRFVDQLANGELDPAWQIQAAEAMEKRARGDFDEWKEREFEEYWGQKHEYVPASDQKAGGEIKGTPKEEGAEKEETHGVREE